MSLFPPHLAARYRASGHWGDVTIPAMFKATYLRAPGRLGLVDPPDRAEVFEGAPRRLTYGEMAAEVDRYAAILQGHGLGPGSLVATQLPNISELVLIYLAVSQIGAVLSPISVAYRGAELRGMAEIADFDAYISVGRMRGKAYYAERMEALAPGTILLGLGEGLPASVTRIDTARADTPPTPLDLDADSLFAVFWTSGTEGLPKAVPKTHNNMMASSLGAWRILGLPDGANILAPFPFVNAAAMGGLMMCWMRTAGAMILHHPFDVTTFIDQLKTEDIAYTMVAPTVLVYLRDKAADPDLHPALHRLHAIGTGSAPPDPEVFAFFDAKFDIPVLNFFGSNEGVQLCSSPSQVNDPRKRASFFPREGDEGWADRPDTLTANGGTFKLVDPLTGATLTAPGDTGEMHIRGPALMPGYFSREGLRRDRIDAHGFFATGDLFQISDCGTLIRFHARSRELIVRGGMKISPVELDGLLSALPGVREVAVAAYPDQEMGEKVCLFAALEPGADLDLDAVKTFCNAHQIAKFKWPERLILVDSLPRTPLAKLDRKALTRRLAEQEEAHHA
ncbi:class I adenylate-forming enzyme family protein [Hoeflea sp. BAL378]|uniref:class I adenylate-forming enzyme family protein n=1 Tax=Hoeflea sp. BAL378 TaxID=1547437 RepID=UPI00126989F1|nr:class I adenylate-forming enzyme family protein [Hoeflea sp. BAL378]